MPRESRCAFFCGIAQHLVMSHVKRINHESDLCVAGAVFSEGGV